MLGPETDDDWVLSVSVSDEEKLTCIGWRGIVVVGEKITVWVVVIGEGCASMGASGIGSITVEICGGTFVRASNIISIWTIIRVEIGSIEMDETYVTCKAIYVIEYTAAKISPEHMRYY